MKSQRTDKLKRANEMLTWNEKVAHVAVNVEWEHKVQNGT